MAWNILGRNRRASTRTAALEHALDTAGWALASSTPQLEPVSEEDARRAGALYIDRRTDPEPLAVALIVAHCQRGDDPQEAVDPLVLTAGHAGPVPGVAHSAVGQIGHEGRNSAAPPGLGQ